MRFERIRPCLWWAPVLLGLLICPSTWADSLWLEDVQRLRVGLKLFPAVLGAVEDVARRYGHSGHLEVWVTYQGSDDSARTAVATLSALEDSQGLRLEVQARSLDELLTSRNAPAAIFIASFGLSARHLRHLSEHHQRLVFSPFAGDVAKGAVAGVHVTDHVLPAVNLTQAERAGVRFKDFFLRVAHHAD
jgi:hypothetical protein